jgi:acetyltransferase-like isoleucine patch superfamily enzyme
MKLIRLLHFLFNRAEFLYISFFSCLCRHFLQWKGVKFRGNVRFWGRAKVQMAKGSEIIIGENGRFRSKHTSNLIGINRPCILSTHAGNNCKIIIGDNCGFSGTVIGAFSQIKIGNNVKCGANTLITDSDWHPEDHRSSPPRPIIIGNNVWLGVNSTVLKGVTIGENSVIGANSLVVKDIPANVIAAGNPCKVIKSINNNG